MQESVLGRPATEIDSWQYMKLKGTNLSEPQPLLPKYFGNAGEHLSQYCMVF
jgi:hypothetical protein